MSLRSKKTEADPKQKNALIDGYQNGNNENLSDIVMFLTVGTPARFNF